jgi:hypothetical protein
VLAVVVAEGVAIALLTVLVLGLLRSHALILKALHELGAGLELERGSGSSATGAGGLVPVELETGVVPNSRPNSLVGADVAGTSLTGEEVLIPVTGAGRRTLVAFLSSGCSVCQTFWDQMRSGPLDVPGGARLVVVAKGPQEESATRLRELAGPNLEVVQSSAAWTDYGVPGSPYFVYVEAGVITGEGSSTTWTQVRDLMGQSVDDTEHARRRAGRPADVPSPPSPMTDYADLARADRELIGAGIHPGHGSLYQAPDRGTETVEERGTDTGTRTGSDAGTRTGRHTHGAADAPSDAALADRRPRP